MKIDILKLVRSNILNLTPYSTARDEYKGEAGIFLDANESPYNNGYNRYPDPVQKELKAKISIIKKIPEQQIFIGNGSDEAIDLCFRIFCTPGKDNAIAITPSYGMYKTSAAINDIEMHEIPLNNDFSLPVEQLLNACDNNTKLIFICSPNNPTGNCFNRSDIIKLIENSRCMVVLDEAYIDFTEYGPISYSCNAPIRTQSLASDIDKFPNLIILQTFSKAYGMAGLRIGLAYASKEIISIFSKIKYPYNINIAAMNIVNELLDKNNILSYDIAKEVDGNLVTNYIQTVNKGIAEIRAERKKVAEALKRSPIVKKIYHSDANFILVEVADAKQTYGKLLNAGIIVRDRSSMYNCTNCLRITIGTPQENKKLLEVMNVDEYCESANNKNHDCTENSLKAELHRTAEICRNTKETNIYVKVNLEGKNYSAIDTGLNFFDHMLDQLVHHGNISLIIKAKGDLHIDEHHTIEDTAIALGEAILKALGDKRGIERYGFALPMDECKALVLLDFGGRIDFEWDVTFTKDMVGDVPAEMFKHFFKSLGAAMQCNLHISAKGENNHHLAESIFKAFAKSLKAAIKRDLFNYNIPSSKGVL